MKAKITFMDNSGFIAEFPDIFLVFDYYRDPAHDLEKQLRHSPDKPVIFLVTHNHADHFNTDIFNLAQNHRRVYVLSNDIPTREIHDTMPIAWMSAGDTIDNLPENVTVQAYGSTDAGVSYVVTMSDGTTLFHAGDLNDWHWDADSTPKEAQKATAKFVTEVNRIAQAHPSLDVAFFPVDTRQGENCASGARTFLDTIAVADFFPMHFKGSYEQACDFDAYGLSDKVRQRTVMHCLHRPGDNATVGK